MERPLRLTLQLGVSLLIRERLFTRVPRSARNDGASQLGRVGGFLRTSRGTPTARWVDVPRATQLTCSALMIRLGNPSGGQLLTMRGCPSNLWTTLHGLSEKRAGVQCHRGVGWSMTRGSDGSRTQDSWPTTGGCALTDTVGITAPSRLVSYRAMTRTGVTRQEGKAGPRIPWKSLSLVLSATILQYFWTFFERMPSRLYSPQYPRPPRSVR